MSSPEPRRAPGGIIHRYLRYDPRRFPPPGREAPDLVAGAFDHLLQYGRLDGLTEEQIARAVRLDPAEIARLGPSLDGLIAMLEARKRRILETWDVEPARDAAARAYREQARAIDPPPAHARSFRRAVAGEQIRDLERLYLGLRADGSAFAGALVRLLERLGDRYAVEALAGDHDFTGRRPLDVPTALEVRDELDAIDRLLEQLRQARQDAQLAVIDLDALARFAEDADVQRLRELAEQLREHVRELAEAQGLERTADGWRLSPKAFRLFQSTLLEIIFGDLVAGRRGRHTGPITGEGAVEMPRTRPYAFGDSPVHMDVSQSIANAVVRQVGEGRAVPPLELRPQDIEIHETRNTPRCATAVIIDMSGSMRYGGMHAHAKRMGLALDGLIRSEYPGDALYFIEMATFARPRRAAELVEMMPKPVTLHDPVVRLRADMSDPRITELDVPPHFTNIQHALLLARRHLAAQDTPNRRIVLITDGLPTAHFEDEQLFLLYPPHPRTEQATLREAALCAREEIVINVFLVPSWSQGPEDVQFAQRLAESSRGRVFFTGGRDLDRYVVWDYVERRRRIVG